MKEGFKIAFTGDIVLQDINKDPNYIFESFKEYIERRDVNLCINLESPFIEKGMKPVKDKITLGAKKRQINYLNYLSPILINLSNNHINDYGNKSCDLTFDILKENGLDFFGAGYLNERRNNIIDHKNKIIYVAFTTRSSDFTGSKLFAEDKFIGGYPPNMEQVSELRKQFNTYCLIINLHWGIEDIQYPEVEKRDLAYSLIDHGADIIIGHHPHIIQPYEVYKDKYIFYSLGNFYFNDIKVINQGKELKRYLPKHRKKGIVPIFKIYHNKKTVLEKILKVEIENDKLILKGNYNLKLMSRMTNRYKLTFPIYLQLLIIIQKIKKVLSNPEIIISKISKLKI